MYLASFPVSLLVTCRTQTESELECIRVASRSLKEGWFLTKISEHKEKLRAIFPGNFVVQLHHVSLSGYHFLQTLIPDDNLNHVPAGATAGCVGVSG